MFFLFIFIAAAGAFFQLNIIENHKTSTLFMCLFRIIAAAGAFFRLNIVDNYER